MVNAKLRMYVQEGTPARGYLKTALSIFLYSDIKRLSTFCGHRNGWRWLHRWCFFLCPNYLLKESNFHMFAKQMSRAFPIGMQMVCWFLLIYCLLEESQKPGQTLLLQSDLCDCDLEAWVAALREETCTRGLTRVVSKHQGKKKGGCVLTRTSWLATTQWQAIFALDYWWSGHRVICNSCNILGQWKVMLAADFKIW